MAFLCGIDIGTTGAKAALYSEAGELLAQGYEEYQVHFPRPGWAEQEPEDWWRAACGAIRGMLAVAPAAAPATRRVGSTGTGDGIAGVAVSSQAPTMLPLDGDLRPLRRAIIWMDRRSEAEAREMAAEFGDNEIFELTGNRPDPFYVAPKIRWYRKHEAALFERTRWFASITGYINYRLTGVLTMDPVHAALLGLRRWSDRGWSRELCAFCGVESEQFAPVHPGEHPIGHVTASAALECGLAEGTTVVTGTVDGSAAALEAGALNPGRVAEMTGTSTVLLLPNVENLTAAPFIAMPHAVEGASLLLGAMSATGASLKWFRDELADDERKQAVEQGVDAYELLSTRAADSVPGSSGVIFLPYMMGERAPIWDSSARGVFFGLSLSTTKADLIRAIMEGAAYALRHNVEVAGRAGISIDEVRTVGGGARSNLWNQIKADVLGIPLLLPARSGGAPFGDAVLAGMGAGLIEDPHVFLQETVTIEKRFVPRKENRDTYDLRYETFRSIYENLRTVFERAIGRSEYGD